MNKPFLQFDILKPHSALFHFSTTIFGGVSSGNYATFNLGEYSGDEPDNIEENRRRLAYMLAVGKDNLFLPYQTHGAEVKVIDNDFLAIGNDKQKELLHGVDALVTNCKNICIGVTTADCVPVLMYDPVNAVLGVAHAGWRGTVARIASKTVEVMTLKFQSKPNDIVAVIAPSICADCFEVGDDVVHTFSELGISLEGVSVRNSKTGKMHINLQQVNQRLLNEAGVLSENIEISPYCTYCHPDMFFSARRQTICSGRMVTGGVLR